MTKPEKWQCASCHVRNLPHRKSCFFCAEKRPEDSGPAPVDPDDKKPAAVPERGQAPSTAASLPTAQTEDKDDWQRGPSEQQKWTCHACTLDNDLEDLQCDVCHTPRRTERRRRSAGQALHKTLGPQQTGSGTHAPASSSSLWHCPECQWDNDIGHTACEACKKPRPQGPQQTGSETHVAASSSSSCGPAPVDKDDRKPAAHAEGGVARSGSASQPMTEMEDHDDQPAQQSEGVWYCNECMHTNQPEYDECTECYTARPEGPQQTGSGTHALASSSSSSFSGPPQLDTEDREADSRHEKAKARVPRASASEPMAQEGDSTGATASKAATKKGTGYGKIRRSTASRPGASEEEVQGDKLMAKSLQKSGFRDPSEEVPASMYGEQADTCSPEVTDAELTGEEEEEEAVGPPQGVTADSVQAEPEVKPSSDKKLGSRSKKVEEEPPATKRKGGPAQPYRLQKKRKQKKKKKKKKSEDEDEDEDEKEHGSVGEAEEEAEVEREGGVGEQAEGTRRNPPRGGGGRKNCAEVDDSRINNF